MTDFNKVKDPELYKTMYEKIIKEGYILKGDIPKLFNISINNIDSVLNNFDALELFIYEDYIEIEKSRTGITKKNPNRYKKLDVIKAVNPVFKKYKEERLYSPSIKKGKTVGVSLF